MQLFYTLLSVKIENQLNFLLPFSLWLSESRQDLSSILNISSASGTCQALHSPNTQCSETTILGVDAWEAQMDKFSIDAAILEALK